MDNKDKEKYIEERNDKSKAFKKDQEKQLNVIKWSCPLMIYQLMKLNMNDKKNEIKKKQNTAPPARGLNQKPATLEAGFWLQDIIAFSFKVMCRIAFYQFSAAL